MARKKKAILTPEEAAEENLKALKKAKKGFRG